MTAAIASSSWRPDMLLSEIDKLLMRLASSERFERKNPSFFACRVVCTRLAGTTDGTGESHGDAIHRSRVEVGRQAQGRGPAKISASKLRQES